MPYVIQTNHLTKSVGNKEIVKERGNLRVFGSQWGGENFGDEDDYQSLETYRGKCGVVWGGFDAQILWGAEKDGQHHRISGVLRAYDRPGKPKNPL